MSHEIRGEVLVVQIHGHTRGNENCQLTRLVCCEHHLEVALDAPFAVKSVHDSSRPNPVLFLAEPPGLLQLPDLSPEWHLLVQHGEWSRSGLWRRIYSRQEAATRPGTAGVLELRQTFEGMPPTEPEYLQPAVPVHGVQAVLHQWPETGEVMLTWPAGQHGVTLYANEADFSVEELVELAESAELPSD